MIPGNIRFAQQLDHMIKKRQFRSSTHGQELTLSLIDHILKVNKSKASANDILGLKRYLLGKEIADMLGIKVSEFKSNRDSCGKYHKAYAVFKM